MPTTLFRVVCGAVSGAAVLAALAGCGGDGAGTARPSASEPVVAAPSSPATGIGPGATQVTVTLTEYRLALSQNLQPGHFLIVVKNAGTADHALKLEGPGGEWRTPTLGPGQSATLDVTLTAGRYEMECPVGNHDDRGMKLEATVGTSVASPQPTESESAAGY